MYSLFYKKTPHFEKPELASFSLGGLARLGVINAGHYVISLNILPTEIINKPHLIRSHLIKWREGLSSKSPIKKSGINDMTVVIVLELFAEGILIGGGIFKRGGLTGMVIQMPALSQSLQNIWSVLIKLD